MGQLFSRYVRSRDLAFWSGHQKRIIDAIGPDVVKYVNDFTGGPGIDTAFDSEWTVTRVEAGAGESTATRTDFAGGALLVTTDANENDGVNMQLIGESFGLLTSAREFYFGAFGLQVSDATQSDLFLGLAVTDTDILGGVTDSLGFRKVDASTTLNCLVEKDSSETTATAATVADATALDLEFYWDGAGLEFFVNGASVATPAVTNLPDNELMRLSLHFLAGEAVAKTLTLDKIVAIQFGR